MSFYEDERKLTGQRGITLVLVQTESHSKIPVECNIGTNVTDLMLLLVRPVSDENHDSVLYDIMQTLKNVFHLYNLNPNRVRVFNLWYFMLVFRNLGSLTNACDFSLSLYGYYGCYFLSPSVQ